MLVAQTAAAAGPNQHSAARNAFVFVLKTDNFWFVPWQYSSASEHIHSMFALANIMFLAAASSCATEYVP